MWFFRILWHLVCTLFGAGVFMSGVVLAFFGLLAAGSVYQSTVALGAIQNAFSALWMMPVGIAVAAAGLLMALDYGGDLWEALKRAW